MFKKTFFSSFSAISGPCNHGPHRSADDAGVAVTPLNLTLQTKWGTSVPILFFSPGLLSLSRTSVPIPNFCPYPVLLSLSPYPVLLTRTSVPIPYFCPYPILLSLSRTSSVLIPYFSPGLLSLSRTSVPIPYFCPYPVLLSLSRTSHQDFCPYPVLLSLWPIPYFCPYPVLLTRTSVPIPYFFPYPVLLSLSRTSVPIPYFWPYPILLTRTWNNAQLGNALIKQLEENTARINKEKKEYIEKLQAEAELLKHEKGELWTSVHFILIKDWTEITISGIKF